MLFTTLASAFRHLVWKSGHCGVAVWLGRGSSFVSGDFDNTVLFVLEETVTSGVHNKNTMGEAIQSAAAIKGEQNKIKNMYVQTHTRITITSSIF